MNIDWKKMDGLVPAVVQDSQTLQLLMLGYMNEEALQTTLAKNEITFYSRSKGRLWTKGESSGHSLELVSLEVDCDNDSLLFMARPKGPTCHRNTVSCFGEGDAPGIGFLGRLQQIISDRKQSQTTSDQSYTAKLLRGSRDRIAQKVGEEAVEVVIASKNEDLAALLSESADLVFHLMLLLESRGSRMSDVCEVLRQRNKAAQTY